MGMLKDWWERNIVADDPYETNFLAQLEELRQGKREEALKPRLVTVRKAPSRDEWASWRESPVTEFVMASLVRLADEHAERWHQQSWVGGEADQRQLDALRERADALRGIAEADYEAFCATLELESESPPNAA